MWTPASRLSRREREDDIFHDALIHHALVHRSCCSRSQNCNSNATPHETHTDLHSPRFVRDDSTADSEKASRGVRNPLDQFAFDGLLTVNEERILFKKKKKKKGVILYSTYTR